MQRLFLQTAAEVFFHEAMKLRENFYQLEVYAPRVARAESTAAPGTEALFSERTRKIVRTLMRLG